MKSRFFGLFLVLFALVGVTTSALSQHPRAGSNYPASSTNYQEAWYAAPVGSQSGWGMMVVHEGNILFAMTFIDTSSGNRPRQWKDSSLRGDK